MNNLVSWKKPGQVSIVTTQVSENS